jgi:cathepsin F
MMYSAVRFLAVVGVAQAAVDPTDIHKDAAFPAFKDFITNFRAGIPYGSELETLGRFTAFKGNLQRIAERNAKKQEKHGVTQFADLTPEEFRARFNGFRPTTEELKKKVPHISHGVASNYTAASIDWNAKGALTPIKNQGQCGSCWAFSATEQLETDYYLKYGELKTLSPQQITSCTTTCLGCGGGNPINAWDYVNAFGGQDPNKDYPYVSGTTGQTGSCDASASQVSEDVSSTIGYMISSAPSGESNMLKQIEQSPMSIIVDATLWQTYESGVITTASGCGTSLDHAVQATGYNANGNYWIIRNSWGETWGNDGFVYVEYGHNVCGLTAQATITTPTTVAKLRPA